jgi:hypothetical protein
MSGALFKGCRDERQLSRLLPLLITGQNHEMIVFGAGILKYFKNLIRLNNNMPCARVCIATGFTLEESFFRSGGRNCHCGPFLA